MKNFTNEELIGLKTLGWSETYQAQYELLEDASGIPARVLGEKPPLYSVRDGYGREWLAEVPGRWRYRAEAREDLPGIGDWVLVETRPSEGRGTLTHLFDRKTCLRRKAAGDADRSQIIASNVDTTFIVASLNSDLNLRRLERYLAVVWDSGSQPVVLLSKSDLVGEASESVLAVEKIAPGVPVLAFSSVALHGLEAIERILAPGKTYVVIGSSGVGKSTLVNRLIGSDVMDTGAIRAGDDKGRHTTTGRHLFQLPSGALLIDTPGMRELGLWEAEEGLEAVFGDIEELARQCRFTNCTHEKEPGCAINLALSEGRLDPARLESYRRLAAELEARARKHDKSAQSKHKAGAKSSTKALRERLKDKGRK